MPGEEDIENRGGLKNRANRSYSSSTYLIDDSESQWTSWLVPMILVANIVMFLVIMYVNNCPKHNSGVYGKCLARLLGKISFQPLKENPLFGPSSQTLVKLGGLEWTKVVQKHQEWRLITAIWLHAGVIHLLANMLSLVFIGIRLEQQFGFVRIGIIYLMSGFGGSILSSLFIRNNVSVGSSGALFGLLGAMLSELLKNWHMYTNKVTSFITLLVIIVINLAVGILPHDNFAHLGGFFVGFFLGFVLLPQPQYEWDDQQNVSAGFHVKSKFKSYQYVLWLISVVLLIVGFTVALMMLFRRENGKNHCH